MRLRTCATQVLVVPRSMPRMGFSRDGEPGMVHAVVAQEMPALTARGFAPGEGRSTHLGQRRRLPFPDLGHRFWRPNRGSLPPSGARKLDAATTLTNIGP